MQLSRASTRGAVHLLQLPQQLMFPKRQHTRTLLVRILTTSFQYMCSSWIHISVNKINSTFWITLSYQNHLLQVQLWPSQTFLWLSLSSRPTSWPTCHPVVGWPPLPPSCLCPGARTTWTSPLTGIWCFVQIYFTSQRLTHCLWRH